MAILLTRYWKWGLTVLMGIGVFLFWGLGYPHALSYQEQYQLFLWTTDYFWERLSIAGGFADWLGEFIVQFYYYPWIGAVLLAILFVVMQRLAVCLLPSRWYLLSFMPPILLWWLMGDVNVLLPLPVAVTLALALACVPLRGRLQWVDVVLIPVAWWLTGPVLWLYVIARLLQRGWRNLWTAGWLVAVQVLGYAWLLPQWPFQMVMTGLTYYRVPMQYPHLHGYEREVYELIWQDCQIRHEQWDKIIKRAGQYEVKTTFWSNSVNLALSQKRLLADRMFDFYQSGDDALIMPMKRDMTSNLPSAETYYRLGLVNSAQRYMFDIQESILNGKKSGRCTKCIIECMLVNGHYKSAMKYVDLLEKSLFYRGWAKEVRQMVTADAKTREQRINAHPQLGRLRQIRFKEDFLYSHSEKDKIFGLLFMNNHENKMALDYFIGEMLLRGNVQGVMQYMPWAQQYGGYRMMPLGYQDAVQCIQKRGDLPGSMYGAYVKRMMRR